MSVSEERKKCERVRGLLRGSAFARVRGGEGWARTGRGTGWLDSIFLK